MIHLYAPKSILTVRPKPIEAPVIRSLAYPDGAIPADIPIRKDAGLSAVVLISEYGRRSYGCQRAYINSELRMVMVFDEMPRCEVMRKWPQVPNHLQA